MVRKVTPEEAQWIRDTLPRVKFVPGVSCSWPPDDWLKAKALVKDIAKYKPTSACLACHVKELNHLREAVDLPPLGGEASESLRTRRLHVCRGVAGDGSDACEYLRWNDSNCGKCGCFVAVKASFKFFNCPVNKWPTR